MSDERPNPSLSRLRLPAVILLVLVLAAELAGSARNMSQTWDEACHMLAGYRYWTALDFGINSEHPPLVKELATLPLLFIHPQISSIPRGTSKVESFVAARKFLYSNHADTLLLWGRMAAALFTLYLALLLFEVAGKMFGALAGVTALVLGVFEPNLLAHGALITTDVASACCLFAAVYAFYRYVQRPSGLRLLECGIAAGLCLAVKHSGLLVFPILFLLAASEVIIGARILRNEGETSTRLRSAARRALQLTGALAAITAVALALLWSAYAFRFRARPAPLAMTPPLAEYVKGVGHPPLRNAAEAGAILTLYRWKVLPEAYLYGLADVLTVSEGPRPTFIFGNLYPTAQWFYFPGAFLIKSSLGFLLLLLLVPAAKSLRTSAMRREIIFLTLPPIVYLAVSMTSGLNVGIRHILPVYPFLLVLGAGGAAALAQEHRRWAYVAGTLIALHVASSLHAYPHYTAYSNLAWGGPTKTYRVLSDSNVDWGQGLKAVKSYLDSHQIRDCWLAYFGSADPDDYGIPCRTLPDNFTLWWGKSVEVVPQTYEGTVLISATELNGTYTGPDKLSPYEPFRKLKPTANVGGSVLAFQGRFDMTEAAALSRAQHAWQLQTKGQLTEAFTEARESVALAPGMTYAHYMMGNILAAANLPGGARREYEAALELARSKYPQYQWFWIPFLEPLIKRLPPSPVQ